MERKEGGEAAVPSPSVSSSSAADQSENYEQSYATPGHGTSESSEVEPASEKAYRPSGVNVRDFSCIPWADKLWWCYTPGNQLKVYYRTGGVDSCLASFRRLRRCLALQLKSYNDPETTQHEYDTSDLNPYRYPRTSVTAGVWELKETPLLEPDRD